jgi:ornithine carbamoyltransferase
MTMMECGKDKNPIVAYIGDGNNMTHSWLMLASKLGFELHIATPKGYECDPVVITDALLFCEQSGGKIVITNDPKEAVKGATVVTTDTWISMGQEEEKSQRIRAFEGYIVDEALMSLADKEAIFLHCLPAYRGVEVSEEVLEGEQSLIFEEAENRLHAQKGLMVWLNKHR